MRHLVRPALVLASLFLLCAAAAPAAGPLRPNGDGTVTDLGTGLVWVADRDFAVASGFARDAVLPRPAALELVAAMNAGAIENFGRTGWRLPTERELLRMAALSGGLPRPFGGGGAALPGRGGSNAVPVWPVIGASVLSGFDQVAVFATNSVRLLRDAEVEGDVVVNDASPGPTLRPGYELALERASRVTGDVKADSVALEINSQVTGDVAYNNLRKVGASAGSLTTPLALPVFALLPQFQTALPRDGAEDVFVAAGETRTLAAGDYGSIEIARGGTLVLAGGVYAASTIQAVSGPECEQAPCRSVFFAGPIDLRLTGRLGLAFFARFAPAAGSGLSASDAIVYVGGENGPNGLPVVTFAFGSTLEANVYAPNGTIFMGRHTTTTGALLARDVLLEPNAAVTLDSFFANRAPSAHPQDAFTHGAAPLLITLTGSDPDLDDLRFAIVTGPTQGSLGPVVEDPPPGLGDPRRTSATVTYTPATAGDVEDSFTFEVSDPLGATGIATVRINPADGQETPPPPPPTTVVAFDGAEETVKDRAVTLTLEGDAPTGVELSFAIVAGSGPASGALGPLTPGGESPQRTASVVYTPASGFTGTDGFDFQACGTISGSPVCDTAHVTITVVEPPVEPSELAPDETATTSEERAVQITLGTTASTGSGATAATAPSRLVVKVAPAAFSDGAEIAGNVADADDNGFGDNHNVLPGASPVFVSAGVDQAGGAGSSGTVRIHLEWDVSSLSGTIDSARVRLNTHRGTVDSLDTFFFAGAGGNGTLEDADFETTLEPVGAVMPVPPLEVMAVGEDGSFTFDVTGEVRSALAQGASFFSVQGRVNESLSGPARGLEVRSSASGNLASFLEPQLEITTPGIPPPPPTFTILSLPANGTLRDFFGAPINDVPATLPDARVSYTPNAGFTGTASFSYQAELGSVVDTGLVTITVIAGNCAIDPSYCNDGR